MKRDLCLTQAYVAGKGQALRWQCRAERGHRIQRDIGVHGLRMSRCAFCKHTGHDLLACKHVLPHASTVQTTQRWCAGCSMLQQHVR